MQEAVKKDLEENGLLTVKYANGAKQPLSAYAAMAARSARIESVNLGARKPIGGWYYPLCKYVYCASVLVALVAGAALGGIG